MQNEYKGSDHRIFYCRCSFDCGLRILLLTNANRTAPVITLPDTEQTYTTGTDTDQLLEGVTAYDSHDGDVTASLLIEKVTETGNGEVIVTYAAVDSSNNVAEQSRILKTAGHPASDTED